jgi:hypothetical protein
MGPRPPINFRGHDSGGSRAAKINAESSARTEICKRTESRLDAAPGESAAQRASVDCSGGKSGRRPDEYDVGEDVPEVAGESSFGHMTGAIRGGIGLRLEGKYKMTTTYRGSKISIEESGIGPSGLFRLTVDGDFMGRYINAQTAIWNAKKIVNASLEFAAAEIWHDLRRNKIVTLEG